MDTGFGIVDYIVFGVYVVLIVSIGLYLSRGQKGKERSGEDYFLAGRNLTWWAIGASLIAANISAEQFIGMSGSGFADGLAIAAYEWMAAVTLILVAKYFLPIFLEKGIYTTNQFLATRFNQNVSSGFSIMWLLVYVFVNLTSVTYLGALALENILGIELIYGIIGLAAIAGVYSIFGGLGAVAWTDVIQVIFLIGGGLVGSYLALDAVSPGSVFQGLDVIYTAARDHFDLILERDPTVPMQEDGYFNLPGMVVILGAIWLSNFGYWGFNQYIIQKGLAARSMKDAKNGLIFAGLLKLIIPLIVVIPGIAAYVFFQKQAVDPNFLPDLLGKSMEEIGTINPETPDEAYPWLLRNFVPTGVRGLAFAALVAAIVSSLASMINSTSTLFAIDIYKPLINKNATERQLVLIGRIVAFSALVIATSVAPLLQNFGQVFQFIQEFTGLIYPGVAVVFAMGLFWKRANTTAAVSVALLTFPLGFGAKFLFPNMPFLVRMGYVFVVMVAVASLFIFFDNRNDEDDSEQGGLSESTKRMMKNSAYGFGALGLGMVIFAFSTFNSLRGIGIEGLIFLGSALSMIGVVLYTNATNTLADKNAIRYKPSLFETGLFFNLGAAIIILAVGALYTFLWMPGMSDPEQGTQKIPEAFNISGIFICKRKNYLSQGWGKYTCPQRLIPKDGTGSPH